MLSVEVSAEVLASKDWDHTSLLPLAIERGVSDRDFDDIHEDVRFINKERILRRHSLLPHAFFGGGMPLYHPPSLTQECVSSIV